MKIIDEKGKLLGIINIIDIFIIISILFASIFIYKKLSTKVSGITSSETIVLKFHSEESPEYVEEYIKEGDRLEDEGNNNFLGIIKNINITDGYMYVGDEDGILYKSHKEGYISIELTAEIDGQLFDNGALIGGRKYEVGHPITVRAGKGKIFGKISALLPKE